MKKGALVQLLAGFDTTVPNVVIFQFNPETMQHTWSQGFAATGAAATTATAAAAPTGANPYAVSGSPSGPGSRPPNPKAIAWQASPSTTSRRSRR